MEIKPPHTDWAFWKLVLDWVWALFVMPLLWCVHQIQKLKEKALVSNSDNLMRYVTRQEYYRDMSSMDKKLDRIIDRLDGKADK